ncbi:MAG: hypothetical protein V4472_12170 [Pseudomonadota bacterium]
MSTASVHLMAQAIATALPLLLFAVIGIVAILRRRKLRASPPAPPVVAPDGTMTVPVRALYLRRGGIMSGTSHNSLNPRFAIAPDAVLFKVFREDRLPFASIDHIEVREWFGRVYLLFVNAGSPRLLSVNMGDRATAKRVLEALPRSVALTPEAATIRDGVPAAGTPGLRLYGGRFH